MVPSRIYRSSVPDLQLVRSDALSYIFSNPLNISLDKPVLIDPSTGNTRTYGEVKKRTKSLAHGLRQFVGPGDIVALISPNTIDYAIICYAILGCGATVSPANAAYTSLELNAQLQTSGAKVLIAHSSLQRLAEEALKSTSVRKLIIADGPQDRDGQPTAETMATTYPVTDLVAVSPEETTNRLAFLCFSSGTTGKAKGVKTSHLNITANMQQWSAHLPEDWTGCGTAVGFLPLNHMYGLMYYCCLSMFFGNTVVVMPRFDFDQYLTYVEKYSPETLVLVPPVILLFAKDPRVSNFNLRSVKRIMSAAAPLSPELRIAVEEKLHVICGIDVFVYQCWGSTETSPILTGVRPNWPNKKDSVGDLVPNVVCRLIDPVTMLDVEASADGSSKPGEVWCRGPNISGGYYNSPEATKESFVIDSEGQKWYRSGDIAVVDSEGFFSIVDRIKEMIKYKGLQVAPSEIEGKLVDHPAVKDACVIGVWVEAQATELPLAFVVLDVPSNLGQNKLMVNEIHTWINARVASHKRLRGGIIVVEGIPKSPTGKILRRELKDWFLKNRLQEKL